MAVVDAVARFVPGVLGSAASAHEDSFSDGLLEYPQYTRPSEFRGMRVPEDLVEWRPSENRTMAQGAILAGNQAKAAGSIGNSAVD